MCTIHGKAVDDDDATFTVEQLLKWKAAAEAQSLPNVWTQQVLLGLVAPEEDSPDPALLTTLGLPFDTDLEAITARTRAAAQADIESFRSSESWPAKTVDLDLILDVSDQKRRFSVASLGEVAGAYDNLVLRAAPGVGKSTALIMGAVSLLAREAFIPLFIPLAEWSAQASSLLDHALNRRAFFEVTEAELRLLVNFGRVILMLDGWNELDAASRRRAAAEVEALKRQYPELGLILSTRRQAMDVPLAGALISVEPLSDAQQRSIAEAQSGEAGITLLERAWRTPGVTDLMQIPLYLRALLTNTENGRLPETKEEILRLFVEQHLLAWRRREALTQAFDGQEGEFLEALAVSATFAANTTVDAQRARAVVSSTASRLTQAGQFVLTVQPAALLDVLIGEHSLISAGAGGVAFQHQQFQEWYASLEVERSMTDATRGAEQHRRLSEDILNWPVWDESILFAVERLSRRSEPEAVEAAAAATMSALKVDPLLAAEMIYRSSPALWDKVKAEVVDFAGRWHGAGQVDRAARFMITCGKSAFSQAIWALIEADIGQRYVSIFEVARRFRASVLSSTDVDRLKTFPAEQRRRILSELAYHGDADAIELAADLGGADTDSDVQFHVIEACLFRRAEGAALRVLRQADEAVWRRLAASSWSADIENIEVAARLDGLKRAIESAAHDPFDRLNAIVGLPVDIGRAQDVQALIADPALAANDGRVGALVAPLHALYPSQVIAGLVDRLILGAKLPFGGDDLIRESGLNFDSGPIAERVLAPGPAHSGTLAAALAGPSVLAALLRLQLQYMSALRQAVQPLRTRLYEENRWISDRLEAASPDPLLEALMSLPDTDDLEEIADLAEVFARHGADSFASVLPLDPTTTAPWRDRLLRWSHRYIQAVEAVGRYQRDRLVQAMGRLLDVRFVQPLTELLDQEVVHRRALRGSRSVGPVRLSGADNGAMGYFQDYRRAFIANAGSASTTAMLDRLTEPDFGVEAAQALKAMWDRAPDGTVAWRPLSDRSFKDVADWRTARRAGTLPRPVPLADDILKAVEAVLNSAATPLDHDRALALAAVAFQLPHQDRNDLMERLLALPGRASAKLHLLSVRIMTGHDVSASDIIECLRALIVDVSTPPRRLSLEHTDLVRCIALSAMSDDPPSVLIGLDLIDACKPHPSQLRDVVSALAANPSDAAERVLLALPDRDQRFSEDHDWVSAVERRATVPAARVLLDRAPPGVAGFLARSQTNAIAIVMAEHPVFREEVYARYAALPWCGAATTLASIIAEKPDIAGVLLLIEGYAKRGPIFDGTIERALERLVSASVPSAEWSGATEQISQPAPELRKALLSLTLGSNAEAILAGGALKVIDTLRDRLGLVETEPRHPDLESGIAWPQC